MIGVGVAGAGVEQDAQALAIEHQPRQKRGQQRGRERKLIHRMRMRPDRRVVPSPLPKRIFEIRPVKWLLEQLGLIGPGIRLPLTPLAAEHHATVRAAAQAAGLHV